MGILSRISHFASFLSSCKGVKLVSRYAVSLGPGGYSSVLPCVSFNLKLYVLENPHSGLSSCYTLAIKLSIQSKVYIQARITFRHDYVQARIRPISRPLVHNPDGTGIVKFRQCQTGPGSGGNPPGPLCLKLSWTP